MASEPFESYMNRMTLYDQITSIGVRLGSLVIFTALIYYSLGKTGLFDNLSSSGRKIAKLAIALLIGLIIGQTLTVYILIFLI
jgi:Na+/phosphate symporter